MRNGSTTRTLWLVAAVAIAYICLGTSSVYAEDQCYATNPTLGPRACDEANTACPALSFQIPSGSGTSPVSGYYASYSSVEETTTYLQRPTNNVPPSGLK
ncbi:MAG: hypothetical protein GY847_17650 [Proteobacteria bacterium]|nr:hypothetical protein [Pseudomonadota bacterium]